MNQYSATSEARLKTAHPDLQRLFREVLKGFDHTIIIGHRTREEQTAAYESGASKLQYPKSKHNSKPSLAVDAAPYPINWNDTARFYFFGGYVLGVAQKMGIHIRWGGDWDGDTEVKDQNFNDLVHFELKQ